MFDHKFLATAFDHGSRYHGFKLLVHGRYPPVGLPWFQEAACGAARLSTAELLGGDGARKVPPSGSMRLDPS